MLPPTQCCIAGGGPAGLMLGYLLARSGVEVMVLEKHADFLRDFRGDTVHPSTLQVMAELGILDELLKLRHDEVRTIYAGFGDEVLPVADFSGLSTRCRFLAFMPQWDFLDFIARQARRYPGFQLLMDTEVTDIITDAHGTVTGVRASSGRGELSVSAGLVVAADGRHSIVRARARLAVEDFGAPMDVLWFRIRRSEDDARQTVGRFGGGRVLVLIDRGDEWQCGIVIPKDSLEEVRERGLDTFRSEVAAMARLDRSRLDGLRSWDDVKLLTVKVDRLPRWYRPGLLCIGDAAHAMSPIGGVGINLAVQDAVAAANLLIGPLRLGVIRDTDLERVQARRAFPARVTQAAQLRIQQRVIRRVLGGTGPIKPPGIVRLVSRSPWLRRMTGRMLGLGVRPEHIARA